MCDSLGTDDAKWVMTSEVEWAPLQHIQQLVSLTSNSSGMGCHCRRGRGIQMGSRVATMLGTVMLKFSDRCVDVTVWLSL